MSTPSVKSKWQAEIARSGLGPGPVGVGLAMSISANADGTGVYPSMRAVAEGMGCSRGYVERHCATDVEYNWLATVAKAIPGHRGTEYRLTFGRAGTSGQVLQSEALEVSAKCSNQDGQVLQSGPQVLQSDEQVLQSEAASAPTTSMTMKKHHETHHVLNHEEHHELTGKAAWDAACARKTAAEVALAEVMAAVPSGQEPTGKAAWDVVVAEEVVKEATKAAVLAEAMAQAPSFD